MALRATGTARIAAVRRRFSSTESGSTRGTAAFAGQPDIEPLLATVRDSATGEIALLLPLIRRKPDRIRVVEFADLELTDYNAPLLGPAAPREPKAAAILWRDLRRALRRLPGGADLIRFDISAALSWRGWPYALRDRVARELRNYSRLDALLKRALRKPLSREEN